MEWTRTAGRDWISGPWRIRGPIMGKEMFWLYRDGYDDALSFRTLIAAKNYVTYHTIISEG